MTVDVPPFPPKFTDPAVTAGGEARAVVAPTGLRTLWFNTGTLCNLTCRNCYIESSPRNDALVHLGRDEARAFLAEAKAHHPELVEVGFTGGEPFMNPDILGMLEDVLAGGWRALVLTNAMKPMQRLQPALLELRERHGARLSLRVSLDHHSRQGHEALRGAGSWEPTIAGLTWLFDNGFDLAVAGRTVWHEGDADTRAGYRRLFADNGLPEELAAPDRLVLFPEMDAAAEVPEITERCWGLLGKSPDSVMCASSRMVVKRRGAARPAVVSCTLLPYDPRFELGATLAEADQPVALNHPHCAKFCVLGGASCSAGHG